MKKYFFPTFLETISTLVFSKDNTDNDVLDFFFRHPQ